MALPLAPDITKSARLHDQPCLNCYQLFECWRCSAAQYWRKQCNLGADYFISLNVASIVLKGIWRTGEPA
ncbi:MAG: hypothetical protein AAF214_07070 [Pseudomonadota bacterium]